MAQQGLKQDAGLGATGWQVLFERQADFQTWPVVFK